MRRIPESEEIYEQTGRNVAERRRELGLSQTELAERCDLTRGSVANIESGKQRPTLHTLADIAEALGVDTPSLLPSSEASEEEKENAPDGLGWVQEETAAFVIGIILEKTSSLTDSLEVLVESLKSQFAEHKILGWGWEHSEADTAPTSAPPRNLDDEESYPTQREYFQKLFSSRGPDGEEQKKQFVPESVADAAPIKTDYVLEGEDPHVAEFLARTWKDASQKLSATTLAREAAHALMQMIEFSGPREAEESSPILDEELEKRAGGLLQEADAVQIPAPVEKVAEHLGIDVKEADLGEKCSGMLVQYEDLVVIGVNENHHENRKRFTIAHEIAHYMLHWKKGEKMYIGRPFNIDFRAENADSRTEQEENEANRFAAALLMPADQVRKAFKKQSPDPTSDDDGIPSLAEEFNVSSQAIIKRLINLKLISDA